MDTRRSFLNVIATSGAYSLLAREAAAQTPGPAESSPPGPAPKPSASAAPPSALAVATAATMRRFDAHLTDDQLDTIARGIDAQRALGPKLAPKGKPLRNGDAPLPVVRLADPSA